MTRFHESVFGVFFDDLDPLHILHNARYLLLFERALGAFWLDLGWGPFQAHDRPEQFHLVRSNEVEYVEPVRGVGRVRVRVAVERIGRTSLTFGFRMLPMDADRDHARGRRTVVHVAPGDLRPRAWSEEFRAVMAAWLPSAGSPTGAPTPPPTTSL